MSPFATISDMPFSKEDRLGLFLILIECRTATKVNIDKETAELGLIKILLMRIGFFFSEIKTPEDSKTICMAVSKTKSCADELKKAVETKDQVKFKELSGYQPVFPLEKNHESLIKMLREKAPSLYKDFAPTVLRVA
jgi:hypothetical protein